MSMHRFCRPSALSGPKLAGQRAVSPGERIVIAWLANLAVAALMTPLAADNLYAQAREPSLRTWTDSTGKFSVVARWVATEGQKVQMKQEDGKALTVPILNLSASDQRYARAMVHEKPAQKVWADAKGTTIADAVAVGLDRQEVRLLLPKNGLLVVPRENLSADDQDYVARHEAFLQEGHRTAAAWKPRLVGSWAPASGKGLVLTLAADGRVIVYGVKVPQGAFLTTTGKMAFEVVSDQDGVKLLLTNPTKKDDTPVMWLVKSLEGNVLQLEKLKGNRPTGEIDVVNKVPATGFEP